MAGNERYADVIAQVTVLSDYHFVIEDEINEGISANGRSGNRNDENEGRFSTFADMLGMFLNAPIVVPSSAEVVADGMGFQPLEFSR